MTILDTVKGRWQYFALGGIVVVVALAWAVFPSITGGVPDQLISEPVAIGDVRCADCTFFDLDAAGVSAQNGTYDADEAQPALDGATDTDVRWGVKGHGQVTLDFVIGNNTGDSQILIRDLSLEVLDVSEVPENIRMACVPPDRGGIDQESGDVTEFSMGLDADAAGVTQSIPLEEGSSVGIELGAEELRAYRGELNIASPGIYALAIVAEYETTGGESATLQSSPIDLMLIGGSTTLTAIPSAMEPTCQGPGGLQAERPALLSDVVVSDSNGATTVEFVFQGTVPGFELSYLERPITESPSGREIEVSGARLLQIEMSRATGVDLTGEEPVQTYEGPTRIEGPAIGLTEVVQTEDQGGILTWVVGIEEGYVFGYSTEDDPTRIVIEIRE